MDKGGPFRYFSKDNSNVDNETQSFFDKYLSLNKVQVDIAGTKDKLFVVRDLNSYMGLQASSFSK